MTEFLIAAGSSLAYASGWFLSARWLYGRWRADAPVHVYEDLYGKQHATPWTDGGIAFVAMTSSLAWPFVLLAAAVRTHPPKTPSEIASEARKLAESTAELRKANDDWEREIERSRRNG